MGNRNSSISPSSSTETKSESEIKFDNFYEVIDYIATNYILTMDFKSLKDLSEKQYCDKLVVLTADIIEKNFHDMDITYLAQRIKGGVEVNELANGRVSFINEDRLKELDVSNDKQKSIKKKRVCIGIAKFYVKIAHIYAAIVMTINPVYVFKDELGTQVKASLLEKDSIPKGTQRKLFKLNVCDNRIRALKRGEKIGVDGSDNLVSIHPKVCDFNVSKSGVERTLEDEPGITELMKLYLDDNYDYSTGLFTGMSSATEKQFKKDLKTFYKAFTGEDNMPEHISKFSDIKLRDYSKKQGCMPSELSSKAVLGEKYTIDKNDVLFVKYADNIKNMIRKASSNQYKLLSIINDLFTYVNDDYTGKKVIRVNPKLTEGTLQRAVEKTRKYIIDLYVQCENDYVEGVKLYEAIVESKLLETTQSQIDNLKKTADNIVSETRLSMTPKSPDVPSKMPTPSTPTMPLPSTPTTPMPLTPTMPMPLTPTMPMPSTPTMPMPKEKEINEIDRMDRMDMDRMDRMDRMRTPVVPVNPDVPPNMPAIKDDFRNQMALPQPELLRAPEAPPVPPPIRAPMERVQPVVPAPAPLPQLNTSDELRR